MIKIRKLLITAEVNESEIVDQVNQEFEKHKRKEYKDALHATAQALQLSRSSVTSYLYMDKDHGGVAADRMRKYRERKELVRIIHIEDDLWKA